MNETVEDRRSEPDAEVAARPDPLHAADLDAIPALAWRLLARGVRDRRLALHVPAIATIGLDGRPRLRHVVLRAAEAATRRLRFHTDRRSDKVAELARDPRLAIVAYDPGLKVQMRLEGVAHVHHGDAEARAAWDLSKRMSRVCYGVAPASGAAIPAGDAYRLPEDDASIAAGFDSFCAVWCAIDRMEWLSLAFAGHRRARVTWDAAGGPSATWLAP